MSVQSFTLGPFATNCYIVREQGASECFIVDASFESEEIVAALGREKLTPKALLLTHAHADHIAGVGTILRAFPGLPVWIHSAEEGWLLDPEANLSALGGMPVTAPPADRTLHDGENLDLPGGTWRVLHTPGHSPGGITLWNKERGVAFVGDAIFAGSIGRTDFPGCSFQQLERSIREKIYALPGETRCYPGHGPATTVNKERMSNPYVRS
ncbi:MAG: MBL fold metallo-hydrolase [Phycisphaerales bacterium]